MATQSAPNVLSRNLREWIALRGMTQRQLADRAGVSQPFISQIIGGTKTVERRSTLAALAGALDVTVADLLGQTDQTDPVRSRVSAAVPAIRAAVVRIQDGDLPVPTRSAEQIAAQAADIDRLCAASDYGRLAPLLPGLLLDTAAHRGAPLVWTSYKTAMLLRNLGLRDLALSAARIAVSAAEDLEDPAWLGAARFAHTLTLPPELVDTATRIAAVSLAELERAAADEQARQMYGMALLSAALTQAVAGRPDSADDFLALADDEAASLGDPTDGQGFNICAFGPTNAAIWRMMIELEDGEAGKATELGRQINPVGLPPRRHEAYWTYTGRALASDPRGRRDNEALAAFSRAEQASPTQFALNPMAREALVVMAGRRREAAVPPVLRRLAQRTGVDLRHH